MIADPLLWVIHYAFVETVRRFIPWIGKSLSRDVHRRATAEVGHGIEFDGLSLPVPEGPQPSGVRVALAGRERLPPRMSAPASHAKRERSTPATSPASLADS